MSSFPWGRFTVFSTALVGVGYALMKATTPTEEQLYNAMAPDLQRKVDKARAARIARETAMKGQVDAQVDAERSPEATKPIWADLSTKR